MPLAHRIDHPLRLVLAWASGTLTDEEVFAYQNEVWSRPDVAGYDELVDMTAVEHVALPSIERVAPRCRSRSCGPTAASLPRRWRRGFRRRWACRASDNEEREMTGSGATLPRKGP